MWLDFNDWVCLLFPWILFKILIAMLFDTTNTLPSAATVVERMAFRTLIYFFSPVKAFSLTRIPSLPLVA